MGAGAMGVEVCLTSRWDSKGRTLPVSDHIFLGSSTVSWLSSWEYSVVETCLRQAQDKTSDLRLAAAISWPSPCCPHVCPVQGIIIVPVERLSMGTGSFL